MPTWKESGFVDRGQCRRRGEGVWSRTSGGALEESGPRLSMRLLSQARLHGGRCPRPSWPGALSGCPPEGDRGLRRARQQRDDPGQVPGFFVPGVLYLRRSVITRCRTSVLLELRISVGTMAGTRAGPRRLSEVGRATSRVLDAELSTFGCRRPLEFWMLTSRIPDAGDLPSSGCREVGLARGWADFGSWTEATREEMAGGAAGWFRERDGFD